MLRVYKARPEAYQLAAKFLGVPPGEILMVACHNFDLDAARGQGYRTAFVRRPDEWGPNGPPDPVPNPATDLVVTGFAELAARLDCITGRAEIATCGGTMKAVDWRPT